MKNQSRRDTDASYKVKDLYIGVLGYVTKTKNGDLKIERQDIIIIYQKKKLADTSDYYAKEVFTNQKYFFFEGNHLNYLTIDKAINSLAIFSSLPLSIQIFKDTITKNKLRKIYDEIQQEIKPQNKEKEETTLPVTDSILQMILDTSKKVKNAEIDEFLKEKTLKDLEELSEYYVNEIINKMITTETELTIENEYTVKMNSIKRLVEIEQSYQNPENIKKYNLKRQLIQVKKELN